MTLLEVWLKPHTMTKFLGLQSKTGIADWYFELLY